MSDDTVKFFRLGKDKSFRVQAITRNHRGIYFTGKMLKKFHTGSADLLTSVWVFVCGDELNLYNYLFNLKFFA